MSPSAPLSAAVEAEARGRFDADEAALVIEALASSHLPFLEEPSRARERARVHMAVLKIADGNLARFERALEEAGVDWRDVLVMAGLADEDWPDVLAASGFRVPDPD